MISINCRGILLDLSTTKVMGILNLTPDSFYGGSRFQEENRLLKQVEKMLEEGADMLDIGGYSSRPGAIHISQEEELKRIKPAIQSICKQFPEVIVSIDSFRLEVVKTAIGEGASIVNDISAGTLDQQLIPWVAEHKLPYILMHMPGTPQNMQENCTYEDVVQDVNHFFSEKVHALKNLGIDDIILDPGFGFGKTTEHNFQLLKHLDILGFLERPILVGISRKSMIYKTLEISPEEALYGTTALHSIAILKGAKILRVHDVKEAKQVVKLLDLYQKA